jgi:imidazoleglycerol-phosphate dehydratase
VIVVDRETRETTVHVAIGAEATSLETADPFLNHMLVTLAHYSGLTLGVKARGDLRHHLIEDVAITLGEAVLRLVKPTIGRYGARLVPMDDALVEVAIDLGGRPYYHGRLPGLWEHFMRSFAFNAKATLHVRVIRGRDKHHVVEAAFKALGFALREALSDVGRVVSTKC